jgi:hypothetical protein
MYMPRGGAAQPGQAGGGNANASAYSVPKESQDAIRKQEQKAYEEADERANEELDKKEKEALKALKISLGKETYSQGMAPPESASNVLKALKAAKVNVRLEPVTDADGKAVNDDFLQLKDSGTERLQQLSRKIAEQKASKAEMKEVQNISKHAMKINDLRMQVMNVSLAAMQSNNNVVFGSLEQMLRVSNLVRTRKMMNMEFSPEDYALVKKGLERQKRAEAIAATTLAMLAAYQAVINNNGDPKALDVIAEGALKAFPIKVEVSDADAKAYVDALGENVKKTKARYEAMMRKQMGDKDYEKKYKQNLDSLFAQAESASSQKSIGQMAADTNDKYKQDVAKCMKGEDPGPGSLAGGPTCKKLYKAAQTGDTSELPPGAKQAFLANGGSEGGGSAPKGKSGALDAASAAANGDAEGALDAAAKMLPADGAIGGAIQGIAALKKGDPRGAINAALGFVPVPGLKDAFGFASKLLFKG